MTVTMTVTDDSDSDKVPGDTSSFKSLTTVTFKISDWQLQVELEAHPSVFSFKLEVASGRAGATTTTSISLP